MSYLKNATLGANKNLKGQNDLSDLKINLQLFAEDGEGDPPNNNPQNTPQGQEITLEGVQKFLSENEDAKKWFQSQKDSYFSKGLETWKSNNLNTLIEEEINKRFPAETEEQKQIRKLKEEFENERKARIRSELLSHATAMATKEGLPIDIVKYFIGEDVDSTNANLEALKTSWKSELEKAVNERLKGNTPPPSPINNNNENAKKKLELLAKKAKESGRLEDRVAYAKAKREYEQNNK